MRKKSKLPDETRGKIIKSNRYMNGRMADSFQGNY